MFPGTVCRSHFFFFSSEDKQEKGKGFPGSSDGKESACTAGDLGSIPGSGRFPREGNEWQIHSSILAWRIAWTEESGGLQSMGLQRI